MIAILSATLGAIAGFYGSKGRAAEAGAQLFGLLGAISVGLTMLFGQWTYSSKLSTSVEQHSGRLVILLAGREFPVSSMLFVIAVSGILGFVTFRVLGRENLFRTKEDRRGLP